MNVFRFPFCSSKSQDLNRIITVDINLVFKYTDTMRLATGSFINQIMNKILIILIIFFYFLINPVKSYAVSEHEEIYNTGIIQFKNGNFKNAIDSFDIVISNAPKEEKNLVRNAYLAKAESLLESLELDSAMKEYGKIIERFPKTPEAIKAKLGIGLVYYKKNLYDKTRQYLLSFIKSYSHTKYADDAQFWVGMLHFKNKNFKKASISFTALVQNYPKSDFIVEGLLRLGDCYYELKKYKSARNCYRKILTKHSSDNLSEFALYNVGRTYEAEVATKEAISIYEQFIEKYPKSTILPEIINQVAVYFYKKKNFDKSNQYFEQIFTVFPEHDLSEDAKFIYSKTYYIKGDKNDAINLFKNFLDKYPLSKNCSEALLYIGNCYFDLADYHSAIEYYEKGIKNTNESSDSEIIAMLKYSAGLANEKLDNFLDVERYYGEVLYRYPKSLAAAKMYLKRGMDLERNGDYFAAIENYELTANISKNRNIQKNDLLVNYIDEEIGATAQKKAADCYFMQKKFKEASREYLKLAYLFNDSEFVPESYYMSARASEEIGYIKEAKQNYEIVKKKYTSTEWAVKASERLHELTIIKQ